MKTTEEMRRDLRILGRKDPEIATLIEQVELKIYSWERIALHLLLSVAGPSKPPEKQQKQVKKA